MIVFLQLGLEIDFFVAIFDVLLIFFLRETFLFHCCVKHIKNLARQYIDQNEIYIIPGLKIKGLKNIKGTDLSGLLTSILAVIFFISALLIISTLLEDFCFIESCN